MSEGDDSLKISKKSTEANTAIAITEFVPQQPNKTNKGSRKKRGKKIIKVQDNTSMTKSGDNLTDNDDNTNQSAQKCR